MAGCRVLKNKFGDNQTTFGSLISYFDGVENNINRPDIAYNELQQFIPEIPIDMPFTADYPQC